MLRFAGQAALSAPADFEAVLLVARAQAALGRADEAEKTFVRLRAMVDGSPRIYDRLYALACVSAGRDLEKALACAEADLALRQDAGAYHTLALVLGKLGKHDQARFAIETARSIDPRDPAIRKAADELLAGKSGGARATAEKAAR